MRGPKRPANFETMTQDSISAYGEGVSKTPTQRRSRRWMIAALIFTVVNVLGAPFAAFGAEWLHAATHVMLAVVGVVWIRSLARPGRSALAEDDRRVRERLDRLQQSVDAVALEVERIGEAQRFAVKLAAAREERTPARDNPPRGDVAARERPLNDEDDRRG